MRYYGCKGKLLDFIESGVEKTGINHGSVFCDLFSGTTTVAKYFKTKGYTVFANDILEFTYVLARAYIQNNSYPQFKGLHRIVSGVNGSKQNVNYVVEHLNNLPLKEGFIYRNYCPGGTENSQFQRKYFTDYNGKKIDTVRTQIEEWKNENKITTDEYYILLASLIETVPYVANISGNYAAYLKNWDPRALKKLQLRVPDILSSQRKNRAFKKDANTLIKEIESDILYLDPPYNSRQYASNYFILELIAEGWFKKEPNIYGKTGMRPYSEQKSAYCQKSLVRNMFEDLIVNAKTKYILLSYNDEGLLSENEITNILFKRGKVNVFEQAYRRYKSINQGDTDRKIVKEKLYFVKVGQG
ncbi:MAG: DNA adenine methylase [Elusimicrobiota bacterium]